jgi:hypothetical protein
MQRVDRFTENLTISFSIHRSRDMCSSEYPLPKSGILTSIRITNLRGPAFVSVSVVHANSSHHDYIDALEISRGDVTFVDPGRWIEFSAGDVLLLSASKQDPNHDVLLDVTVELSYRVAT